MKWCCLVLLAGPLLAGDGARLFYSKSFPGSTPAYMQVSVERTGEVEYREAPDDDNPLKFNLTVAEATEVFGLADKMDHFKSPIESGRGPALCDRPLRHRPPRGSWSRSRTGTWSAVLHS